MRVRMNWAVRGLDVIISNQDIESERERERPSGWLQLVLRRKVVHIESSRSARNQSPRKDIIIFDVKRES